MRVKERKLRAGWSAEAAQTLDVGAYWCDLTDESFREIERFASLGWGPGSLVGMAHHTMRLTKLLLESEASFSANRPPDKANLEGWQKAVLKDFTRWNDGLPPVDSLPDEIESYVENALMQEDGIPDDEVVLRFLMSYQEDD